MIYSVRARWEELGVKEIELISGEFSISMYSAKKYIYMTEEEAAKSGDINAYKKRKTVMDDYLNMIYKMLRDKVKPEAIMSYVIKKGYSGSLKTLENYIEILAKNNFNNRLYLNFGHCFSYPDDVTVIKRSEVFKYMTTKNIKAKKNEVVARHFEVIKEKYAAVAVLKETYDEFYEILMGSISDKLDGFISKYEESFISAFIDGIKSDIVSVKNAISYQESNGFVEGNNNKFKLIKRILYGRANLDTLFKKCYLVFRVNSKDFDLARVL